jgi:hypothetical protein
MTANKNAERGQCRLHAPCGHLWEQTRRGEREGAYICAACLKSSGFLDVFSDEPIPPEDIERAGALARDRGWKDVPA